MSLWALAVVVLLILVNALYVAAEFSAVAVRRSRVRQLAEDGSRLAALLLPTLEDTRLLDRYIAACQIGITLSSLILGAFGQAMLAVGLGALIDRHSELGPISSLALASTAVLVTLTGLQVIFGELIPKTLALQFPARTAVYTHLPMRWSLAVYGGFIAVLNGSGLFLMRLFGLASRGGHRHVHSPEEIGLLISDSHRGGLLQVTEQQRLHRALKMARRSARQIMVPRRKVQGLDIDASPDQVLETAISSPYTRLLLYRGSLDDVVGLLHVKDLSAYYVEHGRVPPLQRIMRPLTVVPGTVSAERLLGLLRARRSRLAAVVDEYGEMEGIVTLEDVIGELLGDLADEFKGEELQAEALDDGRLRLPGRMDLESAAQALGVHWHSEDADTVAGLVMAALDAVPRGGERVRVDGVELEVEQMDGLAIASVLARRLGEDIAPEEGQA